MTVKKKLTKVVLLGAGLVGEAMAIDLVKEKDFSLKVADINKNTLARLKKDFGIKTVHADLSNKNRVRQIIKGTDLVVAALPGSIGYQILQTIIKAGINVVDISFGPEDSFKLKTLAKTKKTITLVDCGVAPGLTNILTGYATSQLDRTHSIEIYVGGLPVLREWPYEYKIVFSPLDTIDEYTRPAYFIENGQQVVRPALSELELLEFPGIGTLEAFNTDGLRTLTKTVKAQYMKEKTLRYPGHAEIMKILRETGFFENTPVKVGKQRIRPIDLTAILVFHMWKMEKGEKDLLAMYIRIEGQKDKTKKRCTFSLLDYFDEKTQATAMARTTGYTATTVARMIAKGLYTKKGLSAPEYIGKSKNCMEFLKSQLAGYNIKIKERWQRINQYSS